MRFLILNLLAFAYMFGQAPGLTPSSNSQPQGADTTPRYQAIHSQATATTDAITVQQVASTSAQHAVIFESAWVACGAGGSFVVQQDGAAATSTALAISALNTSPPTTVTAWSGSNVGTGAFISAAYPIAVGGATSVDLSKFYLTQNGGTAQNLTIKVTCASGTIATTIQWVEK